MCPRPQACAARSFIQRRSFTQRDEEQRALSAYFARATSASPRPAQPLAQGPQVTGPMMAHAFSFALSVAFERGRADRELALAQQLDLFDAEAARQGREIESLTEALVEAMSQCSSMAATPQTDAGRAAETLPAAAAATAAISVLTKATHHQRKHDAEPSNSDS